MSDLTVKNNDVIAIMFVMLMVLSVALAIQVGIFPER
jgi:hypothetical protein